MVINTGDGTIGRFVVGFGPRTLWDGGQGGRGPDGPLIRSLKYEAFCVRRGLLNASGFDKLQRASRAEA